MRRRRCPTCAKFDAYPLNSVELQLGGRIIAFMRHVCRDCVAKLIVEQGFRLHQPRDADDAPDVVLNLPIAGMHELAHALIRVGSRAKGEPN